MMLTVTSVRVLKKKKRQLPMAVLRVRADAKWAGKQIALKHASTVVARSTLTRQGQQARGELQFEPIPICLRPVELDVVVGGTTIGPIVAPLALVGMRSDPPLPETLALLRSAEQDLFPLVDQFGQYRHRDWPDKTRTAQDLKRLTEQEDRDLAARPGPKQWNQFGGWLGGPQLDATGRFRTVKREGKWWLVDPQGRLFWSHGIDCVRARSGVTPISHREHYFQDLPDPGTPLAQFYGHGNWAPHGFYHGRGRHRTYNYTAANLFRKYGTAWQDTFAQRSHRRLRSWGLNTIGNWSDPQVYRMRKTPYVATISPHARPIAGSEGYWGKFPDPFDPGLRTSLRRRLAAEQGGAVGDPWCIGFFVHNELGWGNETSLAQAALQSPADQPAKIAFVDYLRKKYGTSKDLNSRWGTSHDSWTALLATQQPPPEKRAADDLTAFYTEIARQYFRVCREEVKRAAPRHLYLGCRFAWVNDRAARAAAEFCDVVGYNRYRYTVADFRLPAGVDRPVIIGEFHFGALDRGMLHPGLKPVKNQAERGAAYKRYVSESLAHPQIVGTHWFLYGSQPTTGRGDGENYQIGFLDICDTPYWETISACREVGYKVYDTRSAKTPSSEEEH
jgi:hypothetical protein